MKTIFSFLLFVVVVSVQAQPIDELILNKRFDKALHRIEAALQEEASGDLYFKQALVYKELSKPLLAAKSLEKALLYEPKNSNYLAELGENYSVLGNLYQSVECFRQASMFAPENIGLKARLGRAYLSIDDFKRAFTTFASVRQVDSTNVYFNKQFAFAAFKTEQQNLSIRIYEQVIAENPGDFSSHLNLLAIYKKQKDAANVLKTGMRALGIFPENGTISIRLADALCELKDYENACPYYEIYLKQNEANFDILKNYGISLYFFKKEEQAIKVLEACHKMSSEDQFVDFYLALAYKKLANYPKSIEYLNEAISMSVPDYLSEMYHHLGQIYGANRDFEKSIEALKKAYEADAGNPEILFEIATTYEEFNFNKTLALNYYSTYLKTAGEKAKNANYALDRLQKIKEELFFEETKK